VHIDRRSEIPARKPLVLKALSLIEQNDEWRQLPSLLEGLHKARPQPDLALQEKILRKLQLADQFPVILRSQERRRIEPSPKCPARNRIARKLGENSFGKGFEASR
jgi:hypothetical protein